MTGAMKGAINRALARVNDPGVKKVKTPIEHHALCIAWRHVTKSDRYEETWEGPGHYRLDGYAGDDGRSVATVRRAGDLAQMDLPWHEGKRIDLGPSKDSRGLLRRP